MRNVSILGCGWLGKPLAISLLDDGYSLKGSTTKEEKLALLEYYHHLTFLKHNLATNLDVCYFCI